MQMGNLVRHQKQGICKKRVSCTSAKNIAGVTPGPDAAQGPSMKSKNETDERQAKGDKNIHFITTQAFTARLQVSDGQCDWGGCIGSVVS